MSIDNEQLVMEEIVNSDLYVDSFEANQNDNETEEDIQNIETLSFNDLAITGTDWTVETLVGQIRKGNIQLDPSFQRRDAWNQKVKSRFIESLFLGLPIPQIILAEQKNKKGKFIVIDGKQRLLSLQQFVIPSQDERAIKLTGLEILSKFNRLTYSDIENGLFFNEIDAFNNQTIRTVVIKNWRNVEVLYLLFLRLNTGSVKLSPQELRQALYPGKFIEFVSKESGTNERLQQMLNIKKADFRMRDVEILIRYFAFSFFADDYSGSMQGFLDLTCEKLNKSFDLQKDEIEAAMDRFNRAVDLTNDVFISGTAFKKFNGKGYEDKYNRAVIDIMLFYFSQLVDTNINSKCSEAIKLSFESLCSIDKDFLSSLESTTKSLSSVHYRFKKWGEALTAITNQALVVPKGY